MIFEDERYRAALTELSPILNSLLEPLKVIASELETEHQEYVNLNANEFIKVNPPIKKLRE